MAFTETTFSLLRESVKQSMLDDKQKGLPTGELLEFKPDTSTIEGYLNEVFYTIRYYEYDDSYTKAVFWVRDNIELSDIKINNGNITLTITKKSEKSVTKKGVKLGRALKWAFPEVEDSTIKDWVTKTLTKYSSMYVVFTDRDIHKHYRVLAVTQKLASCMSKKPEYYGIIRPDTVEGDPPWERYIYPTEPYNGSPNLRLALMTKHHPDSKEFNQENQYPFIARAIVMIGEYGELSYERVYGIENASNMLKSVGISNDGTEGGKLNIIYNKYGDIVAPYVDPHNSLDNDGDHLIIDRDGEYEIEHNEGILTAKNREYYCDHCNEYHNDVDEDEYLYVGDVGRVYGDCRDDYAIPYGRRNYYCLENLCYSDLLESYVYSDDAVKYINYAGVTGTMYMDWVHIDYLSENGVVKLDYPFGNENYANEDLCIYTEEGYYFLEDLQKEHYFEFHNDYYCTKEAFWSSAMECYIPKDFAIKLVDDWVTQEYLNNLGKGVNDAA